MGSSIRRNDDWPGQGRGLRDTGFGVLPGRRVGFPYPEPTAVGAFQAEGSASLGRDRLWEEDGLFPSSTAADLVPGILFLLSWDVPGDICLGQASRRGRKQTLGAKCTGPRVKGGGLGGRHFRPGLKSQFCHLYGFISWRLSLLTCKTELFTTLDNRTPCRYLGNGS